MIATMNKIIPSNNIVLLNNGNATFPTLGIRFKHKTIFENMLHSLFTSDGEDSTLCCYKKCFQRIISRFVMCLNEDYFLAKSYP
jgi:hypothetical protein